MRKRINYILIGVLIGLIIGSMIGKMGLGIIFGAVCGYGYFEWKKGKNS
ncbi:hypothetical protein [Falsibacillus pallidus]